MSDPEDPCCRLDTPAHTPTKQSKKFSNTKGSSIMLITCIQCCESIEATCARYPSALMHGPPQEDTNPVYILTTICCRCSSINTFSKRVSKSVSGLSIRISLSLLETSTLYQHASVHYYPTTVKIASIESHPLHIEYSDILPALSRDDTIKSVNSVGGLYEGSLTINGLRGGFL